MLSALMGMPSKQMRHFHQSAIIARYLTTRPKLEAGKELKSVALTLTNSNEEESTELLNNWREDFSLINTYKCFKFQEF